MNRSLVVVAVLFLLVHPAGAQWSEVGLPISNANITDICFASPKTVVCAGKGSLILRSTDGGELWTQVSPTVTGDYADVFFLTAEEGWIAGDVLLHTTDAGITWQVAGPKCANVYFNSSTHGQIAVGTGIMRTTDGGSEWTDVPITGERKDAQINDFHYPTRDTGYAVSAWSIMRTIDGGASWTVASAGWANNDTISSIFELCHFFSGTEGIIRGWYGPTLLRTVNAAKDWDYVRFEHGDASFEAFCFPGASVGYAVGSLGTFYKSTDRGQTWLPQVLDTGGTMLRLVAFGDENIGVAFGIGKMFRTSNAGGVKANVSQDRSDLSLLYEAATSSYLLKADVAIENLSILDVAGRNVTSLAYISSTEHGIRVASGSLATPGVYFLQLSGSQQTALPITF
jgi:photosystem II stability/assembly factor-like uncharacterized protein